MASFDFGTAAQNWLSEIPGIGSFFDDSDALALAELRKNQDIWNSIEPGMVNYDEFTPQEYQSSLVQENPETRMAQMDHLKKLQGLADRGLSEMDIEALDTTRRKTGAQARGAREAIQQNMAARGMSGSGASMALQQMANQGAAERSRAASMSQNAQTAKQRALYQQAYGNQLGGLRDQDYRTLGKNADILNQFNMLNTRASNQGQKYNIDNRYNAATGFQNRQMDWAGGRTGTGQDMAKGHSAQNVARTEGRNKQTDDVMKIFSSIYGGGMGG